MYFLIKSDKDGVCFLKDSFQAPKSVKVQCNLYLRQGTIGEFAECGGEQIFFFSLFGTFL